MTYFELTSKTSEKQTGMNALTELWLADNDNILKKIYHSHQSQLRQVEFAKVSAFVVAKHEEKQTTNDYLSGSQCLVAGIYCKPGCPIMQITLCFHIWKLAAIQKKNFFVHVMTSMFSYKIIV